MTAKDKAVKGRGLRLELGAGEWRGAPDAHGRYPRPLRSRRRPHSAPGGGGGSGDYPMKPEIPHGGQGNNPMKALKTVALQRGACNARKMLNRSVENVNSRPTRISMLWTLGGYDLPGSPWKNPYSVKRHGREGGLLLQSCGARLSDDYSRDVLCSLEVLPIGPGLCLVRKLVVEVLSISCRCLHSPGQPSIDPENGVTLSTLKKQTPPYLFPILVLNLKFASFWLPA